MRTQKEITFSQLKAVFTKDFDTFGKMDPFLEFTIGKCLARTETARGAGKEPSWKNAVVLNFFDETAIAVRSYDEDATENQYMGKGKIELDSLKNQSGNLQFLVLADDGEKIGTVTGKYSVKNLNPTPLLLVRNVRCDFFKEHSLVSKTKPFVNFATEEGSTATEARPDGKGLLLTWTDSLRLRIQENSRINISLLDQNDNSSTIFKYESSAKEFRLEKGRKRFNVLDKNFLSLGAVEFDFETVNLVSKEESSKNEEKTKKLAGELTAIGLERLKADLKKGGQDIFFKFIVGSNVFTSELFSKAPKNLAADLKKTIYAEASENKMTVLLVVKNFFKDSTLGVGYIHLEGLSMGDKKVVFYNPEDAKEEVGSVILNLSPKQVSSKVLTLSAITVNFVEGGDMLGESQPYIIAKVGGWSGRTETGEQNRVSFKKAIQLKYTNESEMDIELWDQDATNDEIVYAEKVKLAELKGSKGEYSVNLTKNENEKLVKKGKVTFKYELIDNTSVVEVKKPEPEPPKPVEKKEEPKVQVKPQQKIEIIAEPKSQTKVEIKAQSKVEPKPQPKLEPKPQPKVQPKVEPKPQPKPEPKVEPVVRPPSNRQKTQPQNPNPLPSPKQRINTQQYKSEQKPDKSSMRRSKIHSQLPSIGSQNIYGDQIYEKQSASTLQRSIVAYSIPKAIRVMNDAKYSGEPSYYNDSCFKPNPYKGAGIGFGRKKQFPDWMQKNMIENPAPGVYNKSMRDIIKPKGPTFGVSHKYYEKVLVLAEKKAESKMNITRKLSPIAERLK